MNPADIINAMADRYSSCDSYTDSGWVDFIASDEAEQRSRFTTHFIRPNKFAFEWQECGPNGAKVEHYTKLISDGVKVYMQAPQEQMEEKLGLSIALAGATGSSVGAAYIVPPLLIDSVRTAGKNLLDLVELRLLEDAIDDCFVLEGTLIESRDHIAWISKHDFSLMRLFKNMSWTEESPVTSVRYARNQAQIRKLREEGIVPHIELTQETRLFYAVYNYAEVSFEQVVDERFFQTPVR